MVRLSALRRLPCRSVLMDTRAQLSTFHVASHCMFGLLTTCWCRDRRVSRVCMV